jgi:four helix bundle protein
MTKIELAKRTKQLSIDTAKMIAQLPYNVINKAYCNQLIRCSSSVGANYRAALRAKSTADFINKLKIVEEELDETMFFLELLKEFNNIISIDILWKELNELLAIIVEV